MSDRPPQAAAIYTRISHDPSGERLGVQRQEDDCRAEALRRAWRIAEVYQDDDRSAFNSRKPRPAYQRMLAELRDGTRDGVMIWRLDRLHRQPRELEEFIVIADKAHVSLATVTGDVDLSTTQGRLLARAWGAFAAHESEVRSERMQRAALERARKGKDAWTTRMFGYESDCLTINKSEAKVVRELARRVLAGDSLRSLAGELNKRRFKTAMGCEWRISGLRSLLGNPRIAGLAQHRGEVVGKGRWHRIIRTGEGARLREFFHDRDRQNSGASSPNVLTGLLRCAYCGWPLVSMPRAGTWCRRRAYGCQRRPGRNACGRVSIQADDLEAHVLARLLERLNANAVTTTPSRGGVHSRRWLAALAELNRSARLLQTLAADLAASTLTTKEWGILRPAVIGRIAEAKAVVMEDTYQRAVAEFIGHPAELALRWQELSFPRRRLLCRGLVQHIVIGPALQGPRIFNSERVSIAWHGEPAFVRARRVRAPRKLACSIGRCRRVSKAAGLCQMHYVRSRTTGSPGAARPDVGHWHLGKTCKLEGCSRISAEAGMCRTHYDTWIADTSDLPRCIGSGCDRPATLAHRCRKHYNTHMRRGRLQADPASVRPRVGRVCRIVDCLEPAHDAALCWEHYRQWLDETAGRPRCVTQGCDRPAEVHGMCTKHDQYTRYHERRLRAAV
jgi:site-specific DNA recombinase